MNSAILLLALIGQSPEPASPWDTAVRIHVVGGWVTGADGPRWDAWDGSGTVIESGIDSAYVLTCAHIFALQTKIDKAKVTVDFFDGKPKGLPQQASVSATVDAILVDIDHVADLSLVKVKAGKRIPHATLMLDGYRLAIGERVRVFGCFQGQDVSAFDTEITALFSTGAPANGLPRYRSIECRLAPATGRSGGGLFNRHDELIGVVGYQYTTQDGGLYAHPVAIKQFLIKNKLVSR